MRRLRVGREAFEVVGSCLCGHEKRSAAQRQPLLQPLAVQWFVTPITIACNPFRSQRGMGLLLRQNSSHRARDAGGVTGEGPYPVCGARPSCGAITVSIAALSPRRGVFDQSRCRHPCMPPGAATDSMDSGSAAGQMLPICAIPQLRSVPPEAEWHSARAANPAPPGHFECPNQVSTFMSTNVKGYGNLRPVYALFGQRKTQI